MRPVLRPGTTAVRRSARTLQVGTVAGTLAVVADAPGVTSVLRLADGTRDVGVIAALARLPVDEVASIVDDLRGRGILLDATCWSGVAGQALVREAAALAEVGATGAEVTARLAARAGVEVEIDSDPTSEPVAAALHRVLTDSGVPACLGPIERPGLVIVVSTGPCPREGFDVLTGAGVAHLPVVVEGPCIRVGPLVRPGVTPCVRCDDLDHAGWDPTWPIVLEQHGRPLARSASGPLGIDATSLWTYATTVATDVIAYCDGRPSGADATVRLLGPDPGDRRAHAVGVAHGCACHVLDDAGDRTPVAPGVRMTA